jgi:two-component system LytT family sensor kinase
VVPFVETDNLELSQEMRLNRTSALTVFLVTTGLGLLLFGYKYLDFAARAIHIPVGIPLIEELTGAWTAGLLFPFVAQLARAYPLDKQGWAGRFPIHLAGVIAYSIVHTSILWTSRSILMPLVGLGPYDYGIMRVRFFMEFFIDVICYVFMLAIIYLSDRRMRTAQLEAKLSEARVHNLRLQLRPHFLFNALNTVSSLMYENPRSADRMMASLCELLRLTLAESSAQEIPLEQELKFLDLYMDIMRLRFEENLTFDLTVEPGSEHALVPQLLLQPLVENAIRHGIDRETAKVEIALAANRDGESLRIKLRDHGPGIASWPPEHGIGLSNTTTRLVQLYGNQHEFELANCDDGGLQVNVAVPFRV